MEPKREALTGQINFLNYLINHIDVLNEYLVKRFLDDLTKEPRIAIRGLREPDCKELEEEKDRLINKLIILNSNRKARAKQKPAHQTTPSQGTKNTPSLVELISVPKCDSRKPQDIVDIVRRNIRKPNDYPFFALALIKLGFLSIKDRSIITKAMRKEGETLTVKCPVKQQYDPIFSSYANCKGLNEYAAHDIIGPYIRILKNNDNQSM